MGHTVPLWISASFIALHSAMFGGALCVLGPFLKEGYHGSIHNDVPLSTIEQSAATALLLLACVPGSLLTGPLVDRFGNRLVLIGNSLLWVLGGLLLCFATVPTILIGRFILGLAVGCASVIPPILLNEIEPTDLKGKVANCHQLFICGAQLILYLLIIPFTSVNHGWKWINGGTFIFFGIIGFFSGFFIPESPSWLLKNNREGDCLATLRLLRQGTFYDFLSKAKSDVVELTHDPRLQFQNNYKQRHTIDSTEHDETDPTIIATHQIFYGEDEDLSNHVQDRYNPQHISHSTYELNQHHITQQSSSTLPSSSIDSTSTTTIATTTTTTATTTPIVAGESNVNEINVAVNADDMVYTELQQLKSTIFGTSLDPNDTTTMHTEAQWSDLFLPQYRLQLLLCIGLMTLQPLSGINGVAMFATRIFGFAGLTETEAIWGTFAIGLLGFIGSFSASLVLDKFGRKLLIVIGAAGCCIFLLLLSISLLCLDSWSTQGTFALIFTLLYILAFQPLGGPIWVSLSEMTSSAIRTKAMPVYCTVNWTFNFLLVFVTLPLMTLFGGGETDLELKKGAGWLFLCFAIICAVGVVFAQGLLIETSGKSEDQIQLELGGRSPDGRDMNGDNINDLTPMASEFETSDSSI